MFRKYLNVRKCPSFTEMVFINESLRPNFVVGVSATIYKNISRNIGTHPMSTFVKNTVSMSPFYSSDNTFGISYVNKKSETQNRNVSASLNANMEGNVSGQMECDVYKNVVFGAWGRREPKKRSVITTLLGWSGFGLNTRVMLSTDDAHPSNTMLSVDKVCRLSDRWSIGSYLVLSGGDAAKSETRSRHWLRPNVIPRSYGAAFRYDGGRETVSALVDQDAEVTVQYQHRIANAFAMGAMMTTDVKHHTSKVTWMYRATLGSGLEIRGQVDTNGVVIGNVRKELSPNMFTMGISAMLDHRTNSVGLGMEMKIGMTSRPE